MNDLWMRIVLIFLIPPLLWSCNEIAPPMPSGGETDLTVVLALGGSFLSGYQDGALFREGQEKSVAVFVDRQLMLAGAGDINPPLLPDEGKMYDYGIGIHLKPWESVYVTRSYLWYRTDCEGKEELAPVKDTYNEADIPKRYGADFLSYQGSAPDDGFTSDFAIPFATLKDLCVPAFGLSYEQGNVNPFYYRIARSPGVSTAVGDALSLNPTFLILWLGMEEIYNYASAGGFQANIPDASEFENRLDSVLQLLCADGAKGVIANIPDMESFPFYTLVPFDGAEMEQGTADSLNDIFNLAQMPHIHFEEGNNPFVIEDVSSPGGYRQMEAGERILLHVPLDSMKCHFYGILINVIHKRYVLTKDEISLIHQAIAKYNQIISEKAVQYGLAFCDMNGFFRNLSAGMQWEGADYNTEFISGGFFSLDGYHPNEKGAGLIANEFIRSINDRYRAVIPLLHCSDCSGIRFP